MKSSAPLPLVGADGTLPAASSRLVGGRPQFCVRGPSAPRSPVAEARAAGAPLGPVSLTPAGPGPAQLNMCRGQEC